MRTTHVPPSSTSSTFTSPKVFFIYINPSHSLLFKLRLSLLLISFLILLNSQRSPAFFLQISANLKQVTMGFSGFKLFLLLALLATSCMAQAPSAAPKVSPAATPTPTPTRTPTPAPAPASHPPSPTPTPSPAPVPSPHNAPAPAPTTTTPTPSPTPSSEAPASSQPAPTPGAGNQPAPEPASDQTPTTPGSGSSLQGWVNRAVIGGTALTGTLIAVALM